MWNNIVVAYDGSEPARKAVTVACDIARRSPEARVNFVHIALINGGAAGTDRSVIDLAQAIQADLENVAAELPNETEVHVLTGTSPAEVLLRTADELDADLIVMGSRGMGGVRGFLGSVSVAVVQRARACVLIAKE